MGYVCQHHPNESAVGVCDRCGHTLCDRCVVTVRGSEALCRSCALSDAGVRRRNSLRPAPRHHVVRLRRELRSELPVAPSEGGDNTANGSDNTANGSDNTANGSDNTANGSDNTANGSGDTLWWSEEEPTKSAWSRRF